MRSFQFQNHASTRQAGTRLALRLLACLSLLAAPSVYSHPAYAGSTGTTNLLMPQGAGTESQDGDFFSSDNRSTGCTGCTLTPLNTIYRYYIEVPAGLTQLRVQIFDADVGVGGLTEQYSQRDRTRNNGADGPFGLTAKYTLKNPAGATVATQTCAHTASTFCADDAWSTLYTTATTPIPNGHWELDVDQSTDVPNSNDENTTNDINAFGIQADTGAQGVGAELPVYYLAQNQIGENLPSAGATNPATKTYDLYPYVTSGCTFTENDFDYDLDNGNTGQNVGSINFTSRSGSFTKNFAAANLSENDVWKSNAVTGFTSVSDSTDYGIWLMAAAISNYTNASGLNGNYSNIYLGNYAATAASTTAPANNAPTVNTLRVYFPNSSNGGAPVKPYMEQEARYVFLGGAGGPNPPAVGSTTSIQVTVQVVNPTASAITLSATNLVNVNVPGAGATYGGSAAVSQGTITAQPGVGTAGTVSWNPGTVAAGTTALLTYLVDVKPTAAGQTVDVVGTVASGNGTTGTWVDETGNATLTFGPLCELSAKQGVVSAAEVADLHATAAGHGAVVEWQTASEIDAAGFDLYRLDTAAGTWHKVNRTMVPSLTGAPQGGAYRVLDDTAPTSGEAFYQVIETEIRGGRRHYPFHVAIEPAGDSSAVVPAGGYERTARRDAAWAGRLAAATGGRATPADGAAATAAAVPATANAAAAMPQQLRIAVTQDGLYRLTPAMLAPLIGPSASSNKKPYAKYTLTNQGQPVAWTLDTDGSLLFYGQAIHSIYTMQNVYWLRQGNGVTMGTTATGGAAPITATGSTSASFSTSVNSRQATFAGVVLPLDPESDYWYWTSLIAGDPVEGSASFPVAAPNVNAGGGQTLTVHLMGATTSANDVQVSLNGVSLGNATWSGITAKDAAFAASGLNTTGTNTVTLTAVLDPGVTTSIAYVQSFDVGYERAFSAVNDSLAFDGSGNSLVTVTGFSGPGVRLLDLTNPLLPALVSGARIDTVPAIGKTPAGAQLTLMPATATTPYLAVGPQGVLAPASVVLTPGSTLATQPGGADYLVITTGDLMPAASSLAALRAAQGLRIAVVAVDDVMTDFNFGIYTPHAVQSFLAYVRTTWNPVPRYVVLAGAGNFDYRNFLGLGGELVPPMMVSTDSGLFSSDNHMVDVNGDGIPDFAVGRLPVLTNSELQAYVSKLAAYESTPGALWIDQAQFFADEVGPDDGVTDYAADSTAIAGALPSFYLPQQTVLTADTIDAARSMLFAGLANGLGLVNYFGHAGLDRLSPLSLLTSSDAVTLTNGPRLPLLAALTCNVNRFDVPGFTSLGELLANQPNGGVIGIWSSSGLSYHPEGEELARLFYLDLGIPGTFRLGDTMLHALTQYANEPGLLETVSLYTLLGDPAIQLKPLTAPTGTGISSNQKE
jgi:hypothetical protein